LADEDGILPEESLAVTLFKEKGKVMSENLRHNPTNRRRDMARAARPFAQVATIHLVWLR